MSAAADRSLRRPTTVLGATLFLITATWMTASADPDPLYGSDEVGGEVENEEDAVVIRASSRDIDISHLATGVARSVSPPVCVFYRDHPTLPVPTGVPTLVPDGGYLYWIVCHEGTPDETASYHIWGPTEGDSEIASHPTRFVQDAFDRVTTTAPTLTLSPGLDRYQLTGIPTFLAIDATAWDDPPSGSVTAAGGTHTITVTAWLEPRYVLWDLGTGDTLECDGPGNTYTEGIAFVDQTIECPYVFTTHPVDHFGDENARHYQISAAVDYEARYRIEGMPGAGTIEGSVGIVTGPAATGQQEVREMRAVLTTNDW